MDTQARRKARRFLAKLNGNVDAWYAGEISYETFTEHQKGTWDAVGAEGAAVREVLLRMLREQLPPVSRAR